MPVLRPVRRPRPPRSRLGTRVLRPASTTAARTPPTLVSYVETTWNVGGTNLSTPSISWQAGDVVVVLGGVEDNTAIPTPTATGLTFTPGEAATAAGASWANSWTAVAGSNGSSAVTSTGIASTHWGMAVWVFRGSDGPGDRAADISAAKTASLWRLQDESAVVEIVIDTSGGAITSHAWTPTQDNEREAQQDGAAYTVFVADWVDEDTANTTSYGITGTASSGTHTKVALEVLGTAAGAPATPDAAPAFHHVTQLGGWF